MKTRISNKLHLVALGFCALMFPNSAVIAQTCGELQENLCGYVSIAVANWNQRFGDTARITEWSFIENARMDVDFLIARLVIWN